MLLQPTTVLGWADGRVVIGIPPGSYPAQAEPTNTPTAGEGIPMILLTTLTLHNNQLNGYLLSTIQCLNHGLSPSCHSYGLVVGLVCTVHYLLLDY